jgi:hypothetical protein
LWAGGECIIPCISCNRLFLGDKRAGNCADCAYSIPDSVDEKSVAGAVCHWHESDGFWQGECGSAFCFNDAGPIENKFNFCPKCGQPISLKQLNDKSCGGGE